LSRISEERIRTNAMVVEISRSPVPSSCALKISSLGSDIPGALKTFRAGRKPPRALGIGSEVSRMIDE